MGKTLRESEENKFLIVEKIIEGNLWISQEYHQQRMQKEEKYRARNIVPKYNHYGGDKKAMTPIGRPCLKEPI